MDPGRVDEDDLARARSLKTPVIRLRVVWGLGVTIASFSPTIRLSSVDLPTLGRPKIATVPATVPATLPAPVAAAESLPALSPGAVFMGASI